MPRPILIISADETSRLLLSRSLRHAEFNTVQTHDTSIALTMMRFDCIGTTVLDATVSSSDRENLIRTLEQRMSHIHLVCVNSSPSRGVLVEVVRACHHCSMQQGLGRVYTVSDSGLSVAYRSAILATTATSQAAIVQRKG